MNAFSNFLNSIESLRAFITFKRFTGGFGGATSPSTFVFFGKLCFDSVKMLFW